MSRAAPIRYVKGDAYGNDFLLVDAGALGVASGVASGGAPLEALGGASGEALADLARVLCDRRTGVGADGLIAWRATPGGASMVLRNADGSPAEVSGNGVRCLAALLVELRGGDDVGGKAGGASGGAAAGGRQSRLTPRAAPRC